MMPGARPRLHPPKHMGIPKYSKQHNNRFFFFRSAIMWMDKLPHDLQNSVKNLISEFPKSESVLLQLDAYYKSISQDKRRKTSTAKGLQPNVKKESTDSVADFLNTAGPTKVEMLSKHVLNITSPIKPDEIIFELPGLSFLSPNRRKLNLVFHLFIGESDTPLPVLSVVNPTTNVPEISVTNLLSAIDLCLLLPILGNTTVPTKKDTVMLAIWLNDEAVLAPTKNEPILCTLNLDTVKKYLIDTGKVPPHTEAQILLGDGDPEVIKPINELIVDFLQRQFSLCGLKLSNFLPSAHPSKNSLNMNDDSVVCVSQNSNVVNDLVMAGAYKGSKEGTVLLVSCSTSKAYLIFGFKKPVLLVNFTSLKAVSYSNITRFTFSMLVTVVNKEGVEESHEFGMIDQKSFQAIDGFVKRMNIEDNSFDEKHREKRTENKDVPVGVDETSAQAEPQGPGSDDEEEDGTYTGAVEEDESGSEVDEEFDSNAESGSDSETDEDDDGESAGSGEDDEAEVGADGGPGSGTG